MWNALTLLRRRRRPPADFAREISEHIALEAERLVAEGWPVAAAASEARRRFGNVGAAQERFHDARSLAFYDEARTNILFAWRGIRHRPLQAIIVVVTLTLGIGISAGAFSTIDVIAFRPRVDASPATFARVFSVYGTDSTPPDAPAATRLSDYLWFRDHVHSLRALAGWQAVAATIDGRAGATHGTLVTCEFFDVYAPVRPLAGRVLQANDCASRDNVVVISQGLWRDVFSSAPDVVGRVLHTNGRPLRVVGVAPLFSGPVNDANFWTPYTMRGYLHLGDDDLASPTALRVTVEGRLREGYSRSDAQAELAVLATQQDVLHHGRRSSVLVTDGSMLNQPGNSTAILTIVALVFLALACLALVACANVTSLLLAVAHTRHVEMALRMALGSGSARLSRMLLTETLALAAIAGGLATVVASRTPPTYQLAHATAADVSDPSELARIRILTCDNATGLARRRQCANSCCAEAGSGRRAAGPDEGFPQRARAIEQCAHGCPNRCRHGAADRGSLARPHVRASRRVAGAPRHEARARAEPRTSRSRHGRVERVPRGRRSHGRCGSGSRDRGVW